MALEADDMTARLRADFPSALRGGQLVPYFQPKAELSSGLVVGVEALARWEHPDLGTLPPAMFTPLAEQLGLMAEFTRHMLRLSLAQHRTWASAGWVIPIAVNVGPDCVIDPGFPGVVADLLCSEQVPGSMLALEVSEQTGTAAVSANFFAQLAELGVRVSLDDFGAGFASLESLGGWPIDELKLDSSLIRPIAVSASFRAIVRTTIDLAHQLGVAVVAEGIESEAVRSELQALGCDIGQGYFLGRPMPADAFAGWLSEHGRLAPCRAMPGHQQSDRRQTGHGQHQAGLAEHVSSPAGNTLRHLSRAARRAVESAGAATLAAAAVMAAAYGLWWVFRWGEPAHQALVGYLRLVPINVAAGFLTWRVSLRKDLGHRMCLAWRLLSVAMWLNLLGNLLQLLYGFMPRDSAYANLAGAVFLGDYAFALSAALALPARRRSGPERLRLLLDMGTVFVGGAIIIWYVALGPTLAADANFDPGDLVTLAEPIGDLLLLFGIVSVIWRGTSPTALTPLRLLAAGVLAFISGDVTYDYDTVHSTHAGGDLVGALWFLALILLFVAAGCQLRAGISTGLGARPFSTRTSVLPYLAVAGSYLLLVIVGLTEVKFDSLGGILLGAVLLTLLVSARQFAALHDYGRLAVRYQELAAIDGMTGLFNRRHFMERAEAAFARAQRLGQPLAALMIDVDDFKQINDAHGHAVGDRVLTELAQACRESVRPDDIVGRYGGDEFSIIAPGITSLRVSQLATQLTRAVARVADGDGKPLAVSVSVGIAECPPRRDLSTLLTQADLAMYEAKRAGGGRWRIFSEAVAEFPRANADVTPLIP